MLLRRSAISMKNEVKWSRHFMSFTIPIIGIPFLTLVRGTRGVLVLNDTS